MKYVKPTRLLLTGHPEFNERWVQGRIAEDPSLLGLGDLIVKDKERIHPRAGRLDLLCQDAESNQRYEIEIQLGRTDESHIIRSLEYWDIERKRYPQYDHTAVIVAEDITSRFLNVIALCANVRETPTPLRFSVEGGEEGGMSALNPMRDTAGTERARGATGVPVARGRRAVPDPAVAKKASRRCETPSCHRNSDTIRTSTMVFGRISLRSSVPGWRRRTRSPRRTAKEC